MPRWVERFYVLWAILTFLFVFIKDRFSSDNLTHAGIILFFFLTLSIQRLKKSKPIADRKAYFILRCVLYAAVVEGFYMITRPVLPSLRFTAGMTPGRMLQNYAIDLCFTLPAYVFIFYVVWRLINRYSYRPRDYALLVALGQALGDGSKAFFASPALLIFLPYVMINYHAMNVAPFLAIGEDSAQAARGGFWKWASPVAIVFAAYMISGFAIYWTAGMLKLS